MKANAEKFRALDAAELDKQLREGAEQMFRLRFQMSMGQMDGVKKVRILRKERARILTVLKQKGTAPSAAAAATVGQENQAGGRSEGDREEGCSQGRCPQEGGSQEGRSEE
jgi:large subunit ribosomal protein L29